VVGTLSTGIAVRRLEASGFTEKAALERTGPVTFVSWPLFNPLAGYGTFVVPAVFILILQQTLLIGIAALRVAERREDESGNEPLWAILGGKLGATALIYLGHAVFMFGVVFSLYGFPMRASWLEVFIFLVPYFAAVTLLGLAVAELFDRPESSTVALAAMSLPALFMSGISFPASDNAESGFPSVAVRRFVQSRSDFFLCLLGADRFLLLVVDHLIDRILHVAYGIVIAAASILGAGE